LGQGRLCMSQSPAGVVDRELAVLYIRTTFRFRVGL
jgi:hypothetical protein